MHMSVYRRRLFAGRRNLSRESILNGETPTTEHRTQEFTGYVGGATCSLCKAGSRPSK